jgi:hypothetical protein
MVIFLKQPNREQIIEILKLILEGGVTREEVSAWAEGYVMQDEPIDMETVVWEFLQVVSGVDIKVTPEEYLYVEQDIIDWIELYSKK